MRGPTITSLFRSSWFSWPGRSRRAAPARFEMARARGPAGIVETFRKTFFDIREKKSLHDFGIVEIQCSGPFDRTIGSFTLRPGLRRFFFTAKAAFPSFSAWRQTRPSFRRVLCQSASVPANHRIRSPEESSLVSAARESALYSSIESRTALGVSCLVMSAMPSEERCREAPRICFWPRSR